MSQSQEIPLAPLLTIPDFVLQKILDKLTLEEQARLFQVSHEYDKHRQNCDAVYMKEFTDTVLARIKSERDEYRNPQGVQYIIDEEKEVVTLASELESSHFYKGKKDEAQRFLNEHRRLFRYICKNASAICWSAHFQHDNILDTIIIIINCYKFAYGRVHVEQGSEESKQFGTAKAREVFKHLGRLPQLAWTEGHEVEPRTLTKEELDHVYATLNQRLGELKLPAVRIARPRTKTSKNKHCIIT